MHDDHLALGDSFASAHTEIQLPYPTTFGMS